MLRAAIIESKKEKREFITAGLRGMDMEISVREFSNEFDFQESLDEKATSYDILILNTTIRHEGDGIIVASNIRAINRQVMICFVSDTQRYYGEAFSVFATGYLLYPFDIGELHNCIGFYYHKSKVERRASIMVKEKGSNYRRFYCRHIVYIESANREIFIHFEDESSIICFCKLDDVFPQLPPNQFVRCHQSYIVNLYFVEEMGKSGFNLQNDISIPISRKYHPSTKEAYYDYMFEKI